MPKIATQSRLIMYTQPSGRGTALSPLSIGRHGRGDHNDDTIPGSNVLFGRNEFGLPETKLTFFEPPGGQHTFQIDFDAVADLDTLEKRRNDGARFNIMEFFIPAGAISNYTNWTTNGYLIAWLSGRITGGGRGGHSKDFSDQPVADNFQYSCPDAVKILPPALSAMTTSETEDINAIDTLTDPDPNGELTGYPGADQLIIAACDAGSGVAANVLYSVNGGGTWAAFGADPFGADEHIADVKIRMMNPTTYRIVVLRLTADASNPPEIAYTDIVFGNEGTSPTWTTVNLGSTNNDAGVALFWPLFDRLYASAGQEIFVSTDQGESFTEAYSGSNAINAFAIDEDENVYAAGASNEILLELESNRGSFSAKTGPSGGGAFTALGISDVFSGDILYAGNGQSIYKSTNKAGSAGAWTALKDFGSNHVVKGIGLVRDNSQMFFVLVSDTSGNEGDVWYTLDGGNTFTEVTNLTNSGYNKIVFSKTDANLAYIAGEDNGATGVLHKLYR